MNSLSLSPSQLVVFLTAAIKAGKPTLVTGSPGIGKSDIIEAVSKALRMQMYISHPVVEDTTDQKGIPAKISDTRAGFLPIGQLADILEAKQPTLWFVDDLGQGTPSVQAGYMQWLLARQCGGKHLPDCVTMVAATNRRSDKAGVSGMLEPVKSRFCSIVELRTDIHEWSSWALTKNGAISPTLIAFLRLRSDLLSAFNPTADMTNSPTPRTWWNLASIEGWKLPRDIEHVAMAGAVGEGPATEYLAFRSLCASMVSVDAILADPMGTALPKTPSERYAVCTGLAARANDKTISRIGQYATRLASADMGEFAALTIRDAIRRVPAIANTADYVTLLCGPIGQLISGQAIQ